MQAARTISNEATSTAVSYYVTPATDITTDPKGYASQDAYTAPAKRPAPDTADAITAVTPVNLSTLGAAAVATVNALTRDWDAPLYFTQQWFHGLSDGLSTTVDSRGAGPLITAAVVATPMVFPLTFFADAINTLAYPVKIAARYVVEQCSEPDTPEESRTKAG